MSKPLSNPILLVLTTLLLASSCFGEQRESFNSDWKFKRGQNQGAEQPDFDDQEWRSLTLPHDWAIEGPFDIKYNARCGGLPFHGTGWYRKEFDAPQRAGNDRVFIEFDGAMYNAHIWVNGKFVGHRPFGYIGFEFDITKFLRATDNVISVRLTPEDFSSRWYPGAGLYRNAWITVRPPVHIAHWGIETSTPKVESDSALLAVNTQVVNNSERGQHVIVRQSLADQTGKQVASDERQLFVHSGERIERKQLLDVLTPNRWGPESPYLYTLTTELIGGKKTLTSRNTKIGFRKIQFDSREGFRLNGKRIQLNGVCLHHDLGPLGAAVNNRATQRQLEIMKEMGVNAIRTSHNPPSPEQLELCDEMGVLVIDEAFDCWEMAKVPNGYNKYFKAWHERDLRDMIRRDRNHPSVILWSIGNEILEQGNKKTGAKLARLLTEICHDEDPSRLSTAGFNYYPASYLNKLAHEVDVVGLNYKPMFYSEAIENEPDFILLGSETSSCVSSRGVYHLPIEAYEAHPSLQVTSYDLIGPKWAYPPDIEFEQLRKNPTVIGEFVWTGFDYLGEPTPYGGRDNSTNGYWNSDWPSRSSYFGCVDLCGLKKDRFYLYQSQWTTQPMIHLLPHWNWEDRGGEKIPVYCYTNCQEAELFLNGKSMGKRTKGQDKTPVKVDCYNWPGGDLQSEYRLRWDVEFEPGVLEVVGYIDGKTSTRTKRVTAGRPAKLLLHPDRKTINADGNDLSFVTVSVLDANGNECPLADNLIQFEVAGVGSLEAVGNGNAVTTESFQASQRKAFSGKCMAIIRSSKRSGVVSLTATADGLEMASIDIKTK